MFAEGHAGPVPDHVTYHGRARPASGASPTGGHDLIDGGHAAGHETAQRMIGDPEAGTDDHCRIDDSLALVTPTPPVRGVVGEVERRLEEEPNSSQLATAR